jgi:hypothetical protein
MEERGANAEACQHERELLAAIPESDLCLTGIPGTEEASIGFAIGGIIEAPRQKGILIDTDLGLFLQRGDATFGNLQPRTGQYTRGLWSLPWSDEIVIAGPRRSGRSGGSFCRESPPMDEAEGDLSLY